MAYSRISHTRFGRAALNYVLNGKGHNNHAHRNEMIASVGFVPEQSASYLQQCERLWGKASSRNKTQMRRIVISFSENELPSSDPKSAATAVEIGMKIAEKAYPGFPFIIAAQSDGKGHKMHIHMLSPNVDLVDYKGFNDDETKHWYLKRHVDEICKEYFELDSGKNSKEKLSQTERNKRQENESNNGECYIWKDDLRERISRSMLGVNSRDEFFERLTENGVDAELKYSKKQGEYILYELVDIENFPADIKVPANLKSKSYKLGSKYDLAEVDAAIESNISASNSVDDVSDQDSDKRRKHSGKKQIIGNEKNKVSNEKTYDYFDSPRRKNKKNGKISDFPVEEEKKDTALLMKEKRDKQYQEYMLMLNKKMKTNKQDWRLMSHGSLVNDMYQEE